MASGGDRPSLTASEALAIVKKFLPLEWSDVDEEEVTVKLLTGGYVNTVHIVTRSSESVREPNQVVVHRSGGGVPVSERGSSSPFAARLEELMVLYASSQLGTGPRVYGITEQLTVQEYFKNHTLTPEDTLDERILCKLARAYGKFHSMNLPISRTKYLSNVESFKKRLVEFSESKENYKKLASSAKPEFDWSPIFDLDFIAEYEWLLNTMEKIGTRYVVITGDENYLNVLVGEGEDDRVLLIDYEMTRYDARGVDIGGHFINRTIKWNDKNNKANGHEILNREMRRKFLQEYTSQFAKSCGILDTPYDADGIDSVDHLMAEVDIGILCYTVSWGFGILSKLEGVIKYENASFCTVAHHLVSSFIKLKQQLMSDNAKWW